MIAGPASPTTSPRITKMPVPMIAPMPSAVRSSSPTARRSCLPSSWVSATRASTGFVAKRPPLDSAVAIPRTLPRRLSAVLPYLRFRRGSNIVRRGDDHHGPARAAHELQRDVAEHALGDRTALGRADEDQIRLALL